MPYITFISALNALPTAMVLFSFFAMDRVTRNIFRLRLLVPCQPLLLDSFEVISGTIQFDNIWNKLWDGNATESLNRIILCSVYFVLVGLALLTWGVDCSDVSLLFLYLILAPTTFAMNRLLVDE